MGTSYTRKREKADGSQVDVTVTLLANPSHLEAINPVVVGRVRAQQHAMGGLKANMKAVVPIIVHGDAAMAGQGIVYEQI